VILSKQKKLTIDDLPDICAPAAGTPTGGHDHESSISLPRESFKIQDMEKELIRMTLKHCGGNKSHAAEQLGISRKTLYEKIARYGIK
jgi:DNA-binding NtrC family response regulator